MFRRFAALALCLSVFTAVPLVTGNGELHAVPASATGKPLLVIRFNQRNVYFERALTQAVQKAEQTKPGIMYDVVSFTPVGPAGNRANANLASVVQTMTSLGIPDSRVQIVTELVDSNLAQEVHLYVY